MPVDLSTILDALNQIAPQRQAELWDKVGLHLGDPRKQVSGGLLCIDLTEAVVAEAVETGCELVVAYHPPIFHPLERLVDDGPWTQRRILAAARAGLAVYSPHTALDAARGGVCDWLVSLIDPQAKGRSVPIKPRAAGLDEFKVVVFVPEAGEAAVRQAMSEAGAGGIGRYRECSFSAPGTGGFRPLEGANPAIGEVGKREEVAERRLEMLVPGARLADVLAALRAAHSYEEPAIDVLRLEAEPAADSEAAGPGRIVTLAEPVTPEALAQAFGGLPEAVVKLGHSLSLIHI